MSNLYIRSQDKEKLYIFGISFNCLQYSARNEYNRKKEKEVHHTICISDGCLEEIAEYDSKERCLEVLDEIEAVCSCAFAVIKTDNAKIREYDGTKTFMAPIPRVYNMPENKTRK